MDSVKYHKWTKEQLIEKIVAYEKDLKALGKNKKKYTNKQRPFDITKYNQRPIALKIAYLGWNYYGYAAQDGENVETIESHLFNALNTAKLIKDRESCRYNRCGRTDKGVSAFCQIVSLCVRSNLPANHIDVFTWKELMEDDKSMEIDNSINDIDNSVSRDESNKNGKKDNKNEELAYVTILNRLLPPDIRIISWSPVDKNFNARFHCTYRTYKYFFPAQRLDIPLMQKAAQKFIGVHDFRNFCKIDPLYNSHYRRTIYSAEIYKMNHLEKNIKIPSSQIQPNELFIDDPDQLNDEFIENHSLLSTINSEKVNSEEKEEKYDIEQSSPFEMYVFEVCGKAFLWHQVRFFMGILFLIGRHLEEPEIIDTLLDLSKHDNGNLGRPSYDLADEFPLVLVDTGYPESTFQWRLEDYFAHDPIYNSKNFFLNVLNLWKRKQIKSAMIETLIRDVKYLQDTSNTNSIKKPLRHFAPANKKSKENDENDDSDYIASIDTYNDKVKNTNINTENIFKYEPEKNLDEHKSLRIYKRKSISDNKDEQQKCETRFDDVIQSIMKGTLCSGSKNVQEKKYVKVMKRQRCESIQCVREKFLIKQEKKKLKKENKQILLTNNK
ncbi:pseudouridine synthase [Neocallimastix californiae]|uniref:Pseudouridine synthase n=1 Tax=Neocallimastix californiae TaxID=1754190 RepID=A0A1Y2CFG1_9FUNG|nr:pseudouridine synthase [Neocallimastix californiae]|eukprot:ORY45791.1 pseudouridine synthase [Neocallimastix californiae]